MARIMRTLMPIAAGLAIAFLACETKVFTGSVDCNYCFTQKPDSVDLVFHWTLETDSDVLTVNINTGTIEEGEYIGSWDLYSNPAYVRVKANETYSCEARYERDGITYWVVDGTQPKLKKVVDYCEQGDCWVEEDVDLYIELKY